jgi:flagellin-like protein
MQKGVSPVVATVLLIMMAVMGAVAVWYWASSYTTTKPSTSDTTQKGYVVVDVYRNGTATNCIAVDIKNTGGLPLNNTVFEVRDYLTGRPAGINGTDPPTQAYVNITSEITAGSTGHFDISMAGNTTNVTSVPFGTYLLRVSTRTPSTTQITGFNDRIFTCS